jgi:hypothetical protein
MEPLYVSAVVKIAVVRCGLVGMIWSSRGSGLVRSGMGWSGRKLDEKHTLPRTAHNARDLKFRSKLLLAIPCCCTRHYENPARGPEGDISQVFYYRPSWTWPISAPKSTGPLEPHHGQITACPRASRRAKGPRYQSLEPGGWELRSLGEQVLAISACHGRTSSSLPTAHWPESECICPRLKN